MGSCGQHSFGIVAFWKTFSQSFGPFMPQQWSFEGDRSNLVDDPCTFSVTYFRLDQTPRLLIGLVVIKSSVEAFIEHLIQLVVLCVAGHADSDLKQEDQDQADGELSKGIAFRHSRFWLSAVLILTLSTMQELSRTAPQHPRNAMTKTMPPTTISSVGADQMVSSMKFS